MKSSENPPAARNQGRQGSPFDLLHQQVDRIFSDFSSGIPHLWDENGRLWGGNGGLMPSIDMHEADGKVVISAELPGVDEQDIDITAEGETLTIAGEKRSEVEHNQGNGYHAERSYGRFSRSISLPFAIDPDAVDARYDRGVLKLTIQKPADSLQNVRKIPIKH